MRTCFLSFAKNVSRKKSTPADSKTSLARERLRNRYRPPRVRMLFVGESPPASGRFFYQANSGLYRAIRETFINAYPGLEDRDFLGSFRGAGCYLIDLCRTPVDQLNRQQRRQACLAGEIRLSRIIKRLRPKIIVTVVRSIAPNVRRAQERAKWNGTHFELPYPGRWKHHRLAFAEALIPILQKLMK